MQKQDLEISLDDVIRSSVDGVDLIQALRRQVGDSRETEVHIHVSAWGLDYLLGMAEEALRRRQGEL